MKTAIILLLSLLAASASSLPLPQKGNPVDATKIQPNPQGPSDPNADVGDIARTEEVAPGEDTGLEEEEDGDDDDSSSSTTTTDPSDDADDSSSSSSTTESTTTTTDDGSSTSKPTTDDTPTTKSSDSSSTTDSSSSPSSGGSPSTVDPSAPTASPGPSSSTTPKAPAPPSKSGGFSGWSFFGGMLLTVILICIAFVGLKYYKIRRGQAGGEGNYNRF